MTSKIHLRYVSIFHGKHCIIILIPVYIFLQIILEISILYNARLTKLMKKLKLNS